MNKLVKKLIVKNQEIKEFIPVGVPEGQVAERVSLSVDGQKTWTDITERQCLAADGPVTFGIMLAAPHLEQAVPKDPYLRIEVPVRGCMTVMAIVLLEHYEGIDLKNDRLELYHCARVTNRHMSGLRRRLILDKMFSLSIERGYYEGVMTKWLYKQLVATYTFPRQVFLIQLGEKIIFPIDICFHDEEKGYFAFGLKVKNRLNQMVQDTRQVTIYTISSEAYETIYELSKSFTLSSEDEVPDFIGSKMTVDILQFKNLTSQIFYTGHISQVQELSKQDRYLHHIHFLRYLSSLETPGYTIEHLKKEVTS